MNKKQIEEKSSIPETTQELLPEYIKILPRSFGFDMHNAFIQGTFYADTRGKNQIGAMGDIIYRENTANNIQYSNLDDLAAKTKWSETQMKELLFKITHIFHN